MESTTPSSSINSPRNGATTTKNNNKQRFSLPTKKSSLLDFTPASELLTPRTLIVGYLNSSSKSTKSFSNPKIQEHVEQNIARIKEGLSSIESSHNTVRKLLDDELKGSQTLQQEIGQIRDRFDETKDEIQKMDSMLIREMKESNSDILSTTSTQVVPKMEEKSFQEKPDTTEKIKEILDEWLEQNLSKQNREPRTDGIGFCQIFVWVLLFVLLIMSLLHIFGFSEPLIAKIANWNPTY
ncbi:predicted protein [Naegleria gruberi]|uniref:Predicted protein n=1 Tax=Naegleria gruberi TaxID=5762 RepID=D2V7D3_NAEGR|nr:uncharacterized protein NAEGRDRAFT_64755 [Naegleria gruberi]EFC47356.1 predicted protein [Naegleria gruberi]|eukprot:XP_002680100.1 predicted protein [Naegleria gruberi strain NEG-M]